ncbi:hypothetical protein V6N13_079751 [Hibiscus sabdariffa]|uniref:MBD domain-containing protein n=1 Tax=Hibiscus sabdariffa TaxID=183260 RepID=A0ABR2RSI7_9ROSI
MESSVSATLVDMILNLPLKCKDDGYFSRPLIFAVCQYPLELDCHLSEDGKGSPEQVPDLWKFVVKKQKDGSSLSYYTCHESGQKFYSYADLMRYVKHAKATELSIYADDFVPLKTARRSKKRANTSEPSEKILDLDESIFELPPITSLDFLDDMTPAEFERLSTSGKPKPEKNPTSNESGKGKAKKQKK